MIKRTSKISVFLVNICRSYFRSKVWSLLRGRDQVAFLLLIQVQGSNSRHQKTSSQHFMMPGQSVKFFSCSTTTSINQQFEFDIYRFKSNFYNFEFELLLLVKLMAYSERLKVLTSTSFLCAASFFRPALGWLIIHCYILSG